MAPGLISFPSREAASEAAAKFAADGLNLDLERFGRASLMVSGGATPVQMFEILSASKLDWPKVTIGLVDERWVAPDHADSNERSVRAHLLTGPAAAASFLPMKTDDADIEAAAADRSDVYAPHCESLSVIVLGMGADGHIASWFPGAHNLPDVVSATAARCVAAVDAPAATVSRRLTLTGSAVLRARRAVMLVFGEEKRRVLLSSGTADPLNCPVRFAIEGLGDRLSVVWAP